MLNPFFAILILYERINLVMLIGIAQNEIKAMIKNENDELKKCKKFLKVTFAICFIGLWIIFSL